MEMYSNFLLALYQILIGGLVFLIASTNDWRKTWSWLLTAATLFSFFMWLYTADQSTVEIASGGFVILASLINTLRLGYTVYNKSYLRQQSKRTFASLAVLSLSWLALLIAYDSVGSNLVVAYTVVSAVIVVFIFFKISSTLLVSREQRSEGVETRFPTVTIAIPARNEDAVLERSLHMHLKSNYPKLEILVLDDCSQDKTAEIIKSFAHQGIRFVSGDSTEKTWLGKNYAYQQLLEAASGELVFFCGVDVNLSKDAVTELVTLLQGAENKMLAVLPRYEPVASDGAIWSVAHQIARYFWQLGITELFSASPPVVGSCWLVDRRSLQSIGGFKPYRQQIEPERSLAAHFASSSSYDFIVARHLSTDVISTKRTKQQHLHMLLVAYPLMHRSIITALLASVGVVVFLAMPLVGLLNLAIYGAANTSWLLLSASGFVLLATYMIIYWHSAPKYVLSAVVMLPFAVIEMSVAMIRSMLEYEFNEIEWKGRNVCMPPLNLELNPRPKKGRRRRRRRR